MRWEHRIAQQRLSLDGHAHLRVRLLVPPEGGNTESPNCVSLMTVTRIFVSVYSCLLKGVMNVSERREEMRRGKDESSEVVKRRFTR